MSFRPLTHDTVPGLRGWPRHAAATSTRAWGLIALGAAGGVVARGRARGSEAVGRMLVTLLLLIAPAPGVAVQLLLLGPFHAGTTLFLLLGILVLDLARDRPVGAIVLSVLLALAMLSDALA